MPHAFRWAQLKLFQTLGYGPDAVTMVSIPLYSNMTLSSFLPSLAMGCKVVLMGKFDAARYLALAEQHRVTHSMMVPVQYQRIMEHPNFDRHDLSSFRMKSCGSAPFAASLKADVLSRWPGALHEYYGMTEGGGVCVLDARQHPDKLHTVGKPAPGHDMRVIDDEGKELAPDEIGEVIGRSGTMMLGYHNLPEKTTEVEWFDAQGRRFIRSGDVGCFDSEGFLTLLDRKKDMIISGGFNVYPCDLEAQLHQHPDVLEVAVAGVPSQRWGETPVAFVVRRPDATVTPEALLNWTNQHLGKAQRLSAVEFVERLPRSEIGKVLKRSLRDAWLAANKAI
jgi:acyl-CoA synthetase (AMP-forming)/AMP-acid ligase II